MSVSHNPMDSACQLIHSAMVAFLIDYGLPAPYDTYLHRYLYIFFDSVSITLFFELSTLFLQVAEHFSIYYNLFHLFKHQDDEITKRFLDVCFDFFGLKGFDQCLSFFTSFLPCSHNKYICI